MNTLLKVVLNCTNAATGKTEIIGNASIICRKTAVNLILQRFFNCFNQDVDHAFWNNIFSINVEERPVWEFNEDSRFESEIDEENPFELDSYENAWV